MTWFRVDDHLHAHSKAVRAGTEAMGLWILAGSWSAAEESDGWVPAYMLTRLAGADGDELAARLVRAGLWDSAEHDGEPGFTFHQWDEHQPTRAQLEAKRADARERMRKAREQGGQVRANSESTSRAVTSTRPDPTRPKDSPAAKAADYTPEFQAFWDAYPNKASGKASAFKAWTKALRTATVEQVMAGLGEHQQLWTAERREARFTPHATTWLNQARWDAELPTLPDMPPAGGHTGPAATLNLCDGTDCPGTRHEWSAGRNRFVCMGAAA